MLAAPFHWYLTLPGAIPDTGPANEHFIRDLGSLFVVMGLALLVAAFRPQLRLPVLLGVLAWYLLHCAVHVSDTITGRLGASHWLLDIPGIYAPSLLIALVTAAIAKQQRGRRYANQDR